MVGLAVWQQPWACLDLITVREGDHDHLMNQMLAWAGEQFVQLDRLRGFDLPYWVEVHEDDLERRDLLSAHGFTMQDRPPDVILSRLLAQLEPVPDLPPGFTIRDMQPDDVDAYVDAHRAAFGTDSMTVDWRTRTLAWPRYTPSLDRMVTAPDGTVAGFCVGWLAGDGQTGQIEPMGVVPAYRRRGLASALLADILAQFRTFGVREASVQTEIDRESAIASYRRAGFAPAGQMLKRGRVF